jgi:hypothetical protein
VRKSEVIYSKALLLTPELYTKPPPVSDLTRLIAAAPRRG